MTVSTEPLQAELYEIKPNSTIFEVSPTTERKLRRPGERTRTRELSDPAFREKMKNARRHIAHQFFTETEMTIKKFRLLAGLSQMDVATAISSSQPHYSKIEAGEVDPRDETKFKLSQVLNISLESVGLLLDATKKLKGSNHDAN